MRHAHVLSPDYVVEAACLGLFLVAATGFTVLLEHPDSPARMSLVDPFVRRALMGLSMGLTAAALIYSPLGMRSGAHMNPAVTLAFVRAGRIRADHATGYLTAHFVGAVLGMLASWALFGMRIAHGSVRWVMTQPGQGGPLAAFAAEFVMTFFLLFVVLEISALARWQRWAGASAAVLVALYITFEAPVSGMSLNPARSFGPALFAGDFSHLWIYFAAPISGALAAAELHRRRGR